MKVLRGGAESGRDGDRSERETRTIGSKAEQPGSQGACIHNGLKAEDKVSGTSSKIVARLLLALMLVLLGRTYGHCTSSA